MLRSASARPRTSPGVTHHQTTSSGPDTSTSSHHQIPPSTTAPTTWVNGATSSPIGSSDITNPPVAENHRKPTSRQRALSRQPADRPGHHVGAGRVGVPARDLLAEQRAADPPVQVGQPLGGWHDDDGQARRPTPSGPRATDRMLRIASASAGTNSRALPARPRVSRSRSTRARSSTGARADRTDRRQQGERAGHRRPVCHRAPPIEGATTCGTGAVRRTAERADRRVSATTPATTSAGSQSWPSGTTPS